ncbi:MAG: hypothetical protein ABJB66_14095 [Gemmatimonadaceae bacterium]
MRNRPGFAMITAMWLIVAIATVAVLFGLEAHERYTLGINASERGVARAAALGALALEQAHLERALRTANAGTNAQRLRSSDPWLDVDSTYTGPVEIDSIQVDVVAITGGTKLNVNQMTEDQLRTFFGYLLNDYSTSDIIAQSIMDWRDLDEQARVNGGERDAYLKDRKMVLPANAPFREVDDLLDVRGMTPEILAQARPYLRTYGGGAINLNAADKYVLRAIPGMTDVILQRILALRQNGGRIRNINDVIPGATGATGRPGQPGGRGGPPPPTPQQALAQRVAANTTVDTQEVEFVISAQAGPQAQPVRLNATVTKNGQNARISWRQW